MIPKILLVGRQLQAKPGGYPTPASFILNDALTEAGIRIQSVRMQEPYQYCGAQGANVVVAFGDDAARACIPGWDGSVQKMRGYIFEGARGEKIIPTVHPEVAQKSWVPWRMLLNYDLQRAKEQSKSPQIVRRERKVHVVASEREASAALAELRSFPRLAFDIEIYDAERVSCVGFAGTPERAVVFPARFFDHARELLTDARIGKIAQNGQFDLHFLLTRCGTRVAGSLDDTLIAWHACYPELAGASQDASGQRKGAKRTHKSLAFFGSLFTTDAWWKDYDFATDHEMFVLNGRDCCITLEVMHRLEEYIARLGVESIYRHTVGLVWPCVEMQARGFRIDEKLRQERIVAIEQRIEEGEKRLSELLLPLIEESFESLAPEVQKLFGNRRVCECCRNASKKREHCWSCAGFEKAPGKKALEEWCFNAGVVAPPGAKKEQLEAMLPQCRACNGAGAFSWLEFNPRSVPQKQAVLYDILKLPKRLRDGKLSTDEDALRGLLAHVS